MCHSALTLRSALKPQSFMILAMATETCSSGLRSLHSRTMHVHPGGGFAFFPYGVLGSAHWQTFQSSTGFHNASLQHTSASSPYMRSRAPGVTMTSWTPISAPLL